MNRRRRSSSLGRGSSRSAPAPAPKPTAVATQPAKSVAPQPVVIQGQSMLGNIASTAAGVAVGHTVGHMITGAISGGSRDAPVEAAVTPAAAPTNQMGQQQQTPCQYEMQQFLNCSQQQADLSLCEGFNQVLKECRLRYSNPNGF